MKVKIKRVTTKDVDTQYGTTKKYGILTEEHGDKWLSAFENKYNKEELAAMKEGDTVNITVTQKGDFLNFRTMSKVDLLEERVALLEKVMLSSGAAQQEEPKTADAPEPDPDDNW